MHFQPDKPFNQLPDLPPKAELETVPVLKATSRAARALAELKGRTHTIPNPTILLNTIVLQEAKLSSEIENISPRTTNSIGASESTAMGARCHRIPRRFSIIEKQSGME
jgi:Fic family protein